MLAKILSAVLVVVLMAITFLPGIIRFYKDHPYKEDEE